ncbi:MAG: hypothetical protein M3393_03910 [Actinomycetota bacterium]|nr:hypothetical protein [Actinomycetota bacterium]
MSTVLVGLLLAGCAGNGGTAGTATDPGPTPGGPLGATTKPPSHPMNRLEKPIAEELSGQVAGQGLSLDYLDCPRWNGRVPQQMTCRGYLDGVSAGVSVKLTQRTTRIEFDAKLQDGVLATASLVRRLRSDGYTGIDCGDRPAYPTVVGSELICSVHESGQKKHVVAEVLDRSGAVQIRDY